MSVIRVLDAAGAVLSARGASTHDDAVRRAHAVGTQQGVWLDFEECVEMADRTLLGMSAFVDAALAVARALDDESPNGAALNTALAWHRRAYAHMSAFLDECLVFLDALGAGVQAARVDRVRLSAQLHNDLRRAVLYAAPRLRAAGYAVGGGVLVLNAVPPARCAPRIVAD